MGFVYKLEEFECKGHMITACLPPGHHVVRCVMPAPCIFVLVVVVVGVFLLVQPRTCRPGAHTR